jgi:tRNA(Ile)-lysidine synthase
MGADNATAAVQKLASAIRASGLVPADSSGVVLVSGGADSACLAAGLVEVLGPERLVALSLNYGLRETADRDEEICRGLCERLGLELVVETPKLDGGNLQAAARHARYVAAERLRALRGADWIATGHTRTDLAETLLYRLATSPGRRALLGLRERRGRIVRPLLGLERAETRRLAGAAGLPFVDDETNLDLRFARNRIRSEVLPTLRSLSDAAERNIAETRAELDEEAEALERAVQAALEAAGAGPGATAIRLETLGGEPRAVRRLALRTLAERAAGREVALGRERVAEIARLARSPEGGELDLGGGLRAVCEQGFVNFASRLDEPAPDPASLSVPGSCRFGRWELRAEVRPAPVTPEGPERATLDAATLGGELLVRAWRDGDRIRPLGMEGTKSLQDLFTDRRVPRSLRRTLPVVLAGERIAWVAGVAVSDEFKLRPSSQEVAILHAHESRIPAG